MIIYCSAGKSAHEGGHTYLAFGCYCQPGDLMREYKTVGMTVKTGERNYKGRSRV